MSKGPKISIITACYNAEATIEQTIQSVLNQTYDNIEYIIVDGASTDGTMDIVYKYRDQINFVISEPDKGIFDAFNKGIKLATGDIIHILNAGDYYCENDVLNNIVKNFELESVDYVVGKLELVDAITGESEFYQFPTNVPIKEAIIKRYCPPHPAFFVRKKCMMRFDEFNIKYNIAADTELMFNCLLHSKGKFIDYVTTVFRKDGISSDPHYDNKRLQELDEIITKVLSLKNPIDSIFDQNLNNLTLMKTWNKYSLMNNRGITSCLGDKPLRIVIFGTKDIAQMLYLDCLKENHDVICFIDNNRQKEYCFDKKVNSKEWLINSHNLYDLCITSIEGQHESEIIFGLKELVPDNKVISWKELISYIIRGKRREG